MGIILASTGLPLLTATGLVASQPAAAAGGGGTDPVPVPEPKPEPGEITLQGPTTSITHRGVTFNFNNPVRWIKGAGTDDPIVITDAAYFQAGTSIISISPASAIINSHWAHGTMKGDAIPNADTSAKGGYQGFDGFMSVEAGGSEQCPYVHSLNRDPGANGAIPIAVGENIAYVKSVRDTSMTNAATTTFMDRYVPITFQNSLPPSAGTWFRPAVFHPTATRAWTFRLEDIDMGVFRNLAMPTGAWSSSTSLNDLRARKMEHAPMWTGTHDAGQRFVLRADQNINYSRDWSRVRCQWLCSLHISPANQIETDARNTLATILAQWAIDMDGSYQLGNVGLNGAGHWHGWVPFLFAGAFMFSNSTSTRAAATAMLNRAIARRSNTYDLQFWVSGLDIGFPYPWWESTRSSSKRMVIETYQDTDLGVPEWRIGAGTEDGSNCLHTSYRDTQFTTLVYEMLAIGLLRNGFGTGQNGHAAAIAGPDDETNQRAASLAYLDRLMTIKPWRFNNFGNTAESEAMYNAWRDTIPSPRWTGRPDVPANPVDEPASGARQIAPGGSSGQISYRFNWLDTYNTNPPILERQVQVSQDAYTFSEDSAVQFVDASAINGSNVVGTNGTGTLSGFRPGTVHLCRWRQRNASGWSRWTAHWELADQSGTISSVYKAPRNQVTTPGTSSTGQALSNVVAPAILYKPYYGSYTPLFEPVADPSEAIALYAGRGYWQGGTGALSSTYQWQRSPTGSGSWSNIGTAQKYLRQAADSGQFIRCRVTVTDGAGNSVTAASNVIAIPAAAPHPTDVINISFDGSAPFDYPAFWAALVAGTTGANFEHYPTWQIEPDVTRGVVAFRKQSANPGSEAQITASASAGSYKWEAQIGGAYFPLHVADNTPIDTIIQIKNGAGTVLSSGSAPAASLPDTLTVSGSFNLASPTALRVRIYTPSSKTNASGAVGGPTISNLRIWKP